MRVRQERGEPRPSTQGGLGSTSAANDRVTFALQLRDRPVLREVLPHPDDKLCSDSGRELLQRLKSRTRAPPSI